MTGEPKVLIASHPTRGVDVGAQAAIWAHLRDARAKGLAVLLISADLDELIGMSDTLWVILRGRLVSQVDPHTVTPEDLGAAMTGAGGGGGLMRDRLSRLLLSIIAAVVALVFAGAITSVLLLLTGHSPVTAIQQMWDYGTQPNSIASILNNATTYYIAAVAVAIGFRMNLFNIGVDGQYRLAALLAAAFAGSVALPTGLRQIATIVVAMLVGAFWAGIVGVLKVTRGVSEVISSIMLNFVATGIIAYLLNPARLRYLPKAATTSPRRRSRRRDGLVA